MTYDCIIIGAGPAGLTAAIYTARAGLKTLVMEAPAIMSQAGYAYLIENYPGFQDGVNGAELISNFKKQASISGAEFKERQVSGLKLLNENGDTSWQVSAGTEAFSAFSVIIASGAVHKRLQVAGEERFLGRGVSYCATCDGPIFKNKEVMVVGGGNTAAEEALYLKRFAKKVMLLHRRDKLRATKVLQDKVLSDPKIEVIWSSVIDEILGDEKVKGIRVKDLLQGSEKEISCDGVFISIGSIPNTGFLEGLLEMDKESSIITDNKLTTSKKGVFACGDCRNTAFKQVITACGEGALAAFSCKNYIETLNNPAGK